MIRKAAILITIAMIAAACGSETATQTAPAADDTTTTLAATTTTTTAEVMTDDSMHDDDAAHDDDAMHDDDAAHDDDHDATEADRVVEVSMSEFAFSPLDLSATKGETVTFKVTNEGLVEHEFRLTTEHGASEHIAAGHEDHDADAATGGHGHGEVILLVAPGGTDSITVTFDHDADFDIVACLVPGHYEAGMHAPFTLEG